MKLTDEIRNWYKEIGSKGGKIGGRKSRGGGRKPIPDDQLTEAQRKRRERYLKQKAKTGS